MSSAEGRRVVAVERLGKRMPLPKGRGLAAFDFPAGSLHLTEAGKKRRASLHVVKVQAGLSEMDPGGLEVAAATLEQFRGTLLWENRTLKRALTDPHILSGIGNAYSDEILHRARLSPFKQTESLTGDERLRLHDTVRAALRATSFPSRSDQEPRAPAPRAPSSKCSMAMPQWSRFEMTGMLDVLVLPAMLVCRGVGGVGRGNTYGDRQDGVRPGERRGLEWTHESVYGRL